MWSRWTVRRAARPVSFTGAARCGTEMAHVFTLEAHRSLRAALVERRHLGVRRVAHRSDARHRGDARKPSARSKRNNSCRSPTWIPDSFARAIRARCRCRTCSRAWCACSSNSAGASSSSASLLRQFDGKRTTAQAIEATFKIAPAAFDKEFDAFVRTRFEQRARELERVAGATAGCAPGASERNDGRMRLSRRVARSRCIRSMSAATART